jgi:hypothetical protein
MISKLNEIEKLCLAFECEREYDARVTRACAQRDTESLLQLFSDDDVGDVHDNRHIGDAQLGRAVRALRWLKHAWTQWLDGSAQRTRSIDTFLVCNDSLVKCDNHLFVDDDVQSEDDGVNWIRSLLAAVRALDVRIDTLDRRPMIRNTCSALFSQFVDAAVCWVVNSDDDGDDGDLTSRSSALSRRASCAWRAAYTMFACRSKEALADVTSSAAVELFGESIDRAVDASLAAVIADTSTTTIRSLASVYAHVALAPAFMVSPDEHLSARLPSLRVLLARVIVPTLLKWLSPMSADLLDAAAFALHIDEPSSQLLDELLELPACGDNIAPTSHALALFAERHPTLHDRFKRTRQPAASSNAPSEQVKNML